MTPEPIWYLQFLGGFEARCGSLRVNRLRTAKTTALLAYLAVHPPHRFTREMLADLFWGDMEPTRALNNLSVALNALRHAFHHEQASPLLRSDARSVGLIPERFMADVLEFEHALALAKRASDTAQRYEQLSRAAHLYQGDFLPSVYDEWALQKAAALQGECLAALEQLTAVDLERGDTLQAQLWLQKTLSISPDDGDALCHLVELYLQARQYEAAAQVCGAWLTQRAEFAETALASRVATLLDEAQRGAQRATRLTHTAPDTRPDKPALLVAAAPHDNRSTLPTPRTRFFGRATEIAQLTERLRDASHACITLTGLGGVGKTRLALELARQLQTNGEAQVFWIALQPIASAEQILPTIIASLGLPVSVEPLTMLRAFCEARGSVLLFLDNLEHLLPDGASCVAHLLEQVPNLRCVVTSRTPLRIGAECLYPLTPLSCTLTPECPALQLFVDRARATAHDFRLTEQNRPVLHALCEQLGGIPLALELAAARLNTLSPKQMLERIGAKLEWLQVRRADLPERHRSLQGVLDATFDLLTPTARAIFARLSLVAGDWSLEQAHAVASPRTSLTEMHTLVESLVEAQLVQRVEANRYRMLEVVREYAQTRLTPQQRRTALQRLCAWTLREAAARAPHAYTAELPNWLAFWDGARPTLLQTLAALEEQQAYHQCLRLMHDTQRYWRMRHLYEDALQRLARLVESGKLSARDRVQAQLIRLRLLFETQQFHTALPLALELGALDRRHSQRGHALYWVVQLAFTLREMTLVNRHWNALQAYYPCEHDPELHHAIHYLKGYLSSVGDIVEWREAEYQFARRSGDPLLQLSALESLTESLMFYGDYDRLTRFLTETQTLCEQLGDRKHLIASRQSQAYCYIQLGQLEAAQQQVEIALALEHELGMRFDDGYLLQALLCRWRGEYEQGLQIALSQVARLEMRFDWHGAASMLDSAAQCAYELGDLDAARRHSDAAMRLRRREIDPARLHFTRTHQAYYHALQGDPDALNHLEQCLQFWRKLRWRPWQATTLYYLGEAYRQQGALERAREYLQESAALNRQMGRALALQKVNAAIHACAASQATAHTPLPQERA